MAALAILFYSVSLLFQLIAACYAVNLFLRANKYQLTFGFLAVGLGLMIGAPISPLLHVFNHEHVSLLDAFLSVPISLCLVLGMYELRKVIIEFENINLLLDKFSKIDSLTGVLSRSEVFTRSELEIERSLRTGHQTAFLMLDIDHFKRVNDEYGHQVGDVVLVDLARHCQAQLRSIDIFGRVGGEEFFVVLPESSAQEALQVAERLRANIASSATFLENGLKIQITISIGISTFNPKIIHENNPSAILKTFFKLSDDAMYRAKKNGRNRVELEK